MFTGLVEKTGVIKAINTTSDGSMLTVFCGKNFIENVQTGDSIAINGTCLTVISFDGESFSAFASNETLSLTNLRFLRPGNEINLEKPMTPDKFFGGHIVQGHIDGIGEILDIQQRGEAKDVFIKLPSASHRKWVVPKGSIAIDGVSLTVNEVFEESFRVTIIPHTWDMTIFKNYKKGHRVNIEYDIIAKYVSNMLESWMGTDKKLMELIENSPYFNKGG